MLPKKGFALPIKKVVGVAIGLAGAGMNLDYINLMNKTILGILLLCASYFLVISGRRL